MSDEDYYESKPQKNNRRKLKPAAPKKVFTKPKPQDVEKLCRITPIIELQSDFESEMSLCCDWGEFFFRSVWFLIGFLERCAFVFFGSSCGCA